MRSGSGSGSGSARDARRDATRPSGGGWVAVVNSASGRTVAVGGVVEMDRHRLSQPSSLTLFYDTLWSRQARRRSAPVSFGIRNETERSLDAACGALCPLSRTRRQRRRRRRRLNSNQSPPGRRDDDDDDATHDKDDGGGDDDDDGGARSDLGRGHGICHVDRKMTESRV